MHDSQINTGTQLFYRLQHKWRSVSPSLICSKRDSVSTKKPEATQYLNKLAGYYTKLLKHSNSINGAMSYY